MNRVELALQSAEALAADPRNPAHLKNVLRQLRAKNEALSSNLIDVVGLGALAAGATSVNPIEVVFPPGSGFIHGFFAGTLDGAAASLSGIGVRIRRETNEEMFFSSGGGEGYPRLIAFRGGVTGDSVKFVELQSFRVNSQARWNVWFKNFSAGALTPFMHFLYEADPVT